jgi:folate-dependent phosphoribosylglycinamide formyltransferase PurN
MTNSSELSVLVITAADYGYNARTIEPILKAEQVNVVGITTIPPTIGTQSQISFGRQVLSAFGTQLFVRQLAMRATYAFRDYISRLRGKGERYSPTSLATKHDIDHVETESVNTDTYLHYVRELDPDVVVAAGATERFESTLLSIPEKGCINVHDSLLPEYRGVMPSFWVLRHDEEQTGVTVHRMVPELDAGEILVQYEMEIEPNDSYHSLRLRTARRSGEALVEALDDIAADSCSPEPLDVDEGSYYSFPEREDVKAFKRNGRTFY